MYYNMFSFTHGNRILDNALNHLLLLKKKKRKTATSKKPCGITEYRETRTDYQVKLRCRQLSNVVKELRKAIMRQDWDETSTLLLILCHPGFKLYSSIIVKVCYILLFCHPNSSFEILQNFVRSSTGYILEEDVNKFIKIIFNIRKSALSPLKSGQYVRKSGDYKVTRDPEFEDIN